MFFCVCLSKIECKICKNAKNLSQEEEGLTLNYTGCRYVHYSQVQILTGSAGPVIDNSAVWELSEHSHSQVFNQKVLFSVA